jgi:hypothetical protein
VSCWRCFAFHGIACELLPGTRLHQTVFEPRIIRWQRLYHSTAVAKLSFSGNRTLREKNAHGGWGARLMTDDIPPAVEPADGSPTQVPRAREKRM